MNRWIKILTILIILFTSGCSFKAEYKMVIATDNKVITAIYNYKSAVMDINRIIETDNIKMVTGNKNNVVISDGRIVEILDFNLGSKGMGMFTEVSSVFLYNDYIYITDNNTVSVYDLKLNQINSFSLDLNKSIKSDTFDKKEHINSFIEYVDDLIFILSYEGVIYIYNINDSSKKIKINLYDYDIKKIRDFSVF